jgi:hypothetical protein
VDHPVPFCLQIKHKLRQQQLQHRLQQAQMLRRRMASMQRSTPTTSAQTTSQQSPTVTGIQQQPIPSNFNSGKPVNRTHSICLFPTTLCMRNNTLHFLTTWKSTISVPALTGMH